MKAVAKLVLMILLLTASVTYAQTKKSAEYLQFAKQKYLEALDSDNHGVRNRTIFLVVCYKMQYPDDDLKPFLKKLHKMSQTDPYLLNRIHGNVASMLLENDALLQAVNPFDYDDQSVFFNKVYSVLSEKKLAAK